MAIRYYLSQLIGTGTHADAFRPAIHAVVAGLTVSSDDGRDDSTSAAGWMFCTADVTGPQHALLDADARIVSVPFEDAGGTPLSLDATVGDVPAAKRASINTKLENNHVPTQDFTLATPLRLVAKRIARRFKVRNAWLRDLDYTEVLDTLVSDIPTARRNNIKDRLQLAGYDTSVIEGPDTIREALKKLLLQPVRANQTRFD